MMFFRFVTLLFLVTFAGNYAPAQTCESIFNTSVLSRFTLEDQETLTTLARRQVELSINFSISKAQKDAALNHLAEQLEVFIADSRLTAQQEQTLRQEYRALVFQFKKELSGEMDNQTRRASEKQKALDRQIEDQANFPIINKLKEKYRVHDLNLLLHAIMQSKPNPERVDDFKFALSIRQIDINARDWNNNTPLHIAVLERTDLFLAMLIKNPNLDINLRNELEDTAFEIALGRNAISFEKFISSHPSFDPNFIGNSGKSLLLLAINRNPEIADILVSHPKFDISIKDSLGQTPLHYSYLNPEIVKLLISKGADINVRDNKGNTPLHFAAHNVTSAEPVELLINGGADINAKNNSNHSALHFAVLQKNLKAVELLLNAKGIDVNIRDKLSHTPLNLAFNGASANYIKIIELLKSKGAIQ